MKKNLKLFIVMMALITYLSTFLIEVRPVFASYSVIDDYIRILEIIPDYTDTKILNNFIASNKTFFPNVTVDSVTLNQFNSMRNDVNGEYDLVYFSKGKYGLVSGDKSSNPTGMNTSDKPTRYNDITNLRAQKIKDMINSGQCVIFDASAFNDKSSKLYNNLNSYATSNVRVNITSFDYTTFKSNVYDKYKSSKKRLKLEYYNFPDTNIEYRANDKLVFAFNAKNLNENSLKYKAKLYIDYNRDGLFKEDELSMEQTNLEYNILNSLEYSIPYVYTANIDWKLDLVALDSNGNETKIKNTNKGSIKYRGKPIKMSVLQLQPGNSFSLNDVFKKNNNKLGLTMDNPNLPKSFTTSNGDVTLYVDTLPLDTFNNNVFGNTNLTYEKYRNLDSNYDMIIFGFKDAFDRDVSSGAPLNAIMSFQQKGLGIMLTHDTFWYKNVGAAVNLKKNFIGLAGQAYDDGNRYKDTIGNDFRYLNDIGKYIKYTIMRADSGILKETISNDVYAMQIDTNTMAVNKIVKANNGLINQYPYTLADSINVGTTHMQYYIIDLEDENVIPWFNLDYSGYKKDVTDSFNYYYTYSTANITYSGTGHTPFGANINDSWHKYSTENSPDELKLFINTMVKSFLAANHKPDLEIINPLDNGTLSTKADKINITFIPYDYDIKDGSNIKAEIYQENENGSYVLKSSLNNLKSGQTQTVPIDNEFYKSKLDNINKKIKIVVSDTQGASVEKVINLKIINDFVEADPVLTYKVFQNTNYPTIEGITGDSKDNGNHRIYVNVKDFNGNILAKNDKNELLTKGGETFRYVSYTRINDTIDFNKPYKVEVYQEHGSYKKKSNVITGDLYIDTQIPLVSDIGVNLNGSFEYINEGNNSLTGKITSFTGNLYDNDPEVTGSVTLQKKNENNVYVSINSQPIRKGNFSVSSDVDTGFGDYRLIIYAKDRAGNEFNKTYYLSTVSDLIDSVSIKALNNKINAIYSNNNYLTFEIEVKNILVDNLTNLYIPLKFTNTQKSKFEVVRVSGATYNNTTDGIELKLLSLQKNKPVKITLKLKVVSSSKTTEVISVQMLNSMKLRYDYQGTTLLQNAPNNYKLDIKVKKFRLL